MKKRFKYIPIYQAGGFIPQVFTPDMGGNINTNYAPLVQVSAMPFDTGIDTLLKTQQLGLQKEEFKWKKEAFNKQIDQENYKLTLDMINKLTNGQGSMGVRGKGQDGTDYSGIPHNDAQFNAISQERADSNAITASAVQRIVNAGTSDPNALLKIYADVQSEILNSPLSKDAYKARWQNTQATQVFATNKYKQERNPDNYDPTAYAVQVKKYTSASRPEDLSMDPKDFDIDNFRSVESLAKEIWTTLPQQSARVEKLGTGEDGDTKYDVVMVDTKGDPVSMKQYVLERGRRTLENRFEDLLDRGAIDLGGRTVEQAREDYIEQEVQEVVDKYAKGKSEVKKVDVNPQYQSDLNIQEAAIKEGIKQTGEKQEKNKSVMINMTHPLLSPKDVDKNGILDAVDGGNGVLREVTYNRKTFDGNLSLSKISADYARKNANSYREVDGNYQKQLSNGEWTIVPKIEYENAQIVAKQREDDYNMFLKDKQEAVQYAISQDNSLKSKIDKDGNWIGGGGQPGAFRGATTQGLIETFGTSAREKFVKLTDEYLANKYKSYQESTYKVIPAVNDDIAKTYNDALATDAYGYIKGFAVFDENFNPYELGAKDKNIENVKWGKLQSITYDSFTNRWYQDILVADKKPEKEGEIPKETRMIRIFNSQDSADFTRRLAGGENIDGLVGMINNKFRHGNDHIEFGPNELNAEGITVTRDPDNKSMYQIHERKDGVLNKVGGSYNLISLGSILSQYQRQNQYDPQHFIINNKDYYDSVLQNISDADEITRTIIGEIESSGGKNQGKNPLSSAKGKYQFIDSWKPQIVKFLDNVNPMKGLSLEEKLNAFYNDDKLQDKFMLTVQAQYKADLNTIFADSSKHGVTDVSVGDTVLPTNKPNPSELGAWIYTMHKIGLPNVKSLVSSGKLTTKLITQLRDQLSKSPKLRATYNRINNLPANNVSFTDEQVTKGELDHLGELLRVHFLDNLDNYQLADD